MKQSFVYRGLVSVSLLAGGIISSPILSTPIVYADDFSAQTGTFTVGSEVVNVRSSASTSAEIVDSYQPGQAINYDQIGTANGYRWISYVGGSGLRRYVAIGTADGSETFGSLSGGSSAATSATSSSLGERTQAIYNQMAAGDFSYIAGIWQNGEGNSYKIHSDGYVEYLSSQYAGHAQLGSNGESIGFRQYMEDGRPTSGAAVFFAVAGESDARPAMALSDTSRDRLLITQAAVNSAAAFYYRVGSLPSEAVTSPAEATPASQSPSSSSSSASSSSSSSTASSSSVRSSSSSQSSSSSSTSSSSSKKATTSSTAGAKTQSGTSLKKGNMVQNLYKTITRRSDLPSTGEVLLGLGLGGAVLIAILAYLAKRFIK